VTVREIEAKSILIKRKKIDSWFITHYGMNLYRGCSHDCIYCDGRSEQYYVEGDFKKDIAAKILSRELDPKRKRIPLKKSFICLGGGVADSYQPAEIKYGLTRDVLKIIMERGFPVHILTKSTVVKRDIDILEEINRKTRAIVSFSFSSTDTRLSSIFEPGVPAPSERLSVIAELKSRGIPCGMFLLPVIPFITDTPKVMETSIRDAKKIGVDFIVFGGMTLKVGKQMDYFVDSLQKTFPDLAAEYRMIYRGSKWGEATKEYYDAINLQFDTIIAKYRIPKRIPASLFNDILNKNDLVIVILEQIEYLLKLKGRDSPYGYAAYSISKLKDPLSTIKGQLKMLKGVGKVTERIIVEILETGTSSYYEKLLIS